MESSTIFSRRCAVTIGIITVLFVTILRLMGRSFLSSIGFGLWTSEANASVTSQLLADPYSLSHVLHGFIFFWLLWLFFRYIPLCKRLVITVLAEVVWEILENSPVIINRYREATVSLGYTGDTILNSFGDLLSCILGFWLASRLPWKVTAFLAVVIELLMLWLFRDNLSLNVLMLFWPIQAIKQWQLS